jgi:hypothetical protein
VENKVSKFASIIAIATSITMLTPSAYADQFSGTGSKVEASVAVDSASVGPLIQAIFHRNAPVNGKGRRHKYKQ